MKEVLPPSKQNLVIDNLKLVHYILRNKLHLNSNYYLYEDCYQEGCLGLTYAAIRYNPDLGYEFSTYAGNMIRCYIIKFIRDYRNEHRYSRSVVSLSQKCISYVNMNDDRTINDAFKELKIPLKYQFQIIEYIDNIENLSFEDTIFYSKKDGDSLLLKDTISDPDSDNFYKSLEEEDYLMFIESIIPKIISDFSETGRYIYIDYITEKMYSIGDDNYYSQRSLANKYKVSQATVSRIIQKGNKNLKELIHRNES